ncbi:hypothetical protein [Cohnella lupini]|uniref:S-layer family protein n=1 Tax=Cohnella lupini TaxID=1294267 RepID=A0A3D9I7J5_9BACL|nr:hypothetical protein [Cohnella lupini]RED57650.1 hypothetical protein DFP95_110123 [Cohnella lupini]
MKKSLSLLLTFALVFGLFANMAAAAETPASAGKLLQDAGVIKGSPSGDLLPDATWKRQDLAVLLSRLLGVEKEAAATVKSHTYKDVRGTFYNGYLSWALTNKYLEGASATSFGFDQLLNNQSFAAVVLRALGVDTTGANYDKTPELAVKAGILPESTVWTAPAKRGETYVALVAALNAEVSPGVTLGNKLGLKGWEVTAATAISSVTATGAKKLTVAFNGTVDTAKVKISVWNGANEVNSKSVTFSADKKSAVVEFANNLLAAEYTVKVEGVATAALEAKVKVEASKVVKIEFPSDKLVIDRNNPLKGSIAYKVLNQYGEDVSSSNAVQVTSSKTTGSVTENDGKIEVTSASALVLDEKVQITALHSGTSTFASVTAAVALPSRISKIDIVSLVGPEGKVLEQTSSVTDFKLLLDLQDQYGNSVTDVTYWATDVATSVQGTSVTFGTPAKDSNDGKVYLPITAISNVIAGTTTLNILSITSGNKDSFDVVVKEAVKVDSLSLTAPSVAPKGETVSIPFTALDQFGNAVKHPSGLTLTANGAGAGGVGVPVTWDKNVAKDTTALNVAISETAGSTIVITGVTSTGKFVQLSFNTVDKAVPTTVGSVKGIDALLVGATKKVTAADNVVVKDQYGRDVTDLTGYSIKVATSGNAVTTTDASLPATFTAGTSKGTTTVTLSLVKLNTAATTDDVEVANSALTFNLKAVAKSEITSYEATIGGTLLDNGTPATYGKEVKVTGVLADGTKVTIPYAGGDNYKVNPSVNTVTYNVDADGAVKAYAVGFFPAADTNKDGDAAIVVTAIGDTNTQIITVPVKVSNKASVPTTLEVVNNGIAEKIDTNYVAVSATAIHAAGGLAKLVDEAVKAVDQYGVELKDGTEPAYSNYATNLPSNQNLGNIEIGKTFTVSAVTPNGVAVSFKVIVKA